MLRWRGGESHGSGTCFGGSGTNITAAQHTEAYVSLTIRWGSGTYTSQAENESSGSSISAYVNSGYAGGAFISAKGTHYVSAGVGKWGPAYTNL